jgi:hypothetical protein
MLSTSKPDRFNESGKPRHQSSLLLCTSVKCDYETYWLAGDSTQAGYGIRVAKGLVPNGFRL